MRSAQFAHPRSLSHRHICSAHPPSLPHIQFLRPLPLPGLQNHPCTRSAPYDSLNRFSGPSAERGRARRIFGLTAATRHVRISHTSPPEPPKPTFMESVPGTLSSTAITWRCPPYESCRRDPAAMHRLAAQGPGGCKARLLEPLRDAVDASLVLPSARFAHTIGLSRPNSAARSCHRAGIW